MLYVRLIIATAVDTLQQQQLLHSCCVQHALRWFHCGLLTQIMRSTYNQRVFLKIVAEILNSLQLFLYCYKYNEYLHIDCACVCNFSTFYFTPSATVYWLACAVDLTALLCISDFHTISWLLVGNQWLLGARFNNFAFVDIFLFK